MAEIINLRRVRKQLKHEQADREAAENRVRFGRTRAEVTDDATAASRSQRALDGARLDPADQPGMANRANESDTAS